MDLTNWATALLTIAGCLITTIITINVRIAEIKKDIAFQEHKHNQLAEKHDEDVKEVKRIIDNLVLERRQDMHELKIDMKNLQEGVTALRVKFAEKV